MATKILKWLVQSLFKIGQNSLWKHSEIQLCGYAY